MNVAPSPSVVVAKNFAAMFADDAIADAQAQTGALADFFGGKEWIEDALGECDAVAVVAKHYFHEVTEFVDLISMRAGRPVSRTAS